MTVSAISVRFDEHTMLFELTLFELTDGRTLSVPLARFPRLLQTTPAERQQAAISRVGLHWEALDEDVPVAGPLASFLS
ncbi:DUF2442 domain-containing protein [Bradyrhizobium sp. SZCCHNS2096]|uniref:DUF2442 domain-containing protein n=1 Tax=Bradyrhizobium sp. SZCCHNS2096 TaxID=3057309 RepID=UPI0029163888|nr:DUF2442 domain-containing protein [Bradyrhizobium sp. SZCCHNS2096]